MTLTALAAAAALILGGCGSSDSSTTRSTAAPATPLCRQAAALMRTPSVTLSHDPATFSSQLLLTVRHLQALRMYVRPAAIRAEIDTVAGADEALAAAVHPRTGRPREARVRAAYARTQAPSVLAAGLGIRAWIQQGCD